ncbi:hypothetical protein DNTS_008797, partial [Danionella cerebrum]
MEVGTEFRPVIHGPLCRAHRFRVSTEKMRAYLALLVALSLPGNLNAIHGLYAFDQPELFQKKNNCKSIPANLLLCHDIEYTDMRLPNLLGHETMNEVLQQASSWTPLVQKQCHPDTKKFLCSLFAPVCLDDLDELIQPCRSLCEGVKSGCAPVMAAFGFPWPDMLDCRRFPLDDDLCIPAGGADASMPVTTEVPKVCDACKAKSENDNEIVDSLCKNDFVAENGCLYIILVFLVSPFQMKWAWVVVPHKPLKPHFFSATKRKQRKDKSPSKQLQRDLLDVFVSVDVHHADEEMLFKGQ